MNLSVIIPNYNHGRYLAQAFDAIISQSIRPDEVIIIDDASTDDSWKIISELACCHPSVRPLRNRENRGVVKGLNLGLRLAAGEYVYFAAADDLVFTELFAESLDLLNQHPEAALCSALCTIMDETGRQRGIFPSLVACNHTAYISPSKARKVLMRHGTWFMGNTAIYRRSRLVEIGGFLEVLESFSDGFACEVLALRYGVCFIPKPLAAWRLTPNGYSLTTIRDIGKSLDILDQTKQLMTTIYTTEFPASYFGRWEARWRFRMAATLLRTGGQPGEQAVSAALGRVSWMDAACIRVLVRLGLLGRRVLLVYLFLRLRSNELFRMLIRRCRAYAWQAGGKVK